MDKLVELILSYCMFKCHRINKLYIFNIKHLNSYMNIVTHSISQHVLCSSHSRFHPSGHTSCYSYLWTLFTFFAASNTLCHSCCVSKSHLSFEIHLKIYYHHENWNYASQQADSIWLFVLNCLELFLYYFTYVNLVLSALSPYLKEINKLKSKEYKLVVTK